MFKRENLRKNFLRVKQNIDQNLGRAEKSEVLTEDQQENEKRVDVVKHAFQNIAKKAGAVLQAPNTEYDKRLKKLPETGLGNAMVESAQALGPETLLGSVCQLCGDCQLNLAREQVQYEITMEQDFITPLQNIVDVDIPSIMKFRKALNKSTLDMDSAKTRYHQAVRQSHVPGANMANVAAKADVIKEELEEASQKVENIKDNLSIELCNFAAKESEHSNRLLMLLQAQADFHRKALKAIEDCIPHMKLAIQNSPAKPCYGMPLEEHLRLMCRDIALVLEACVLTLLETGMEEEGLFRIAGAAMKLKKLKACFDANAVDMEEFSTDPHTVAGALKQYLRELPEPLLTYALYEDFMQAATLPQDQRLQTLWTVISRLPKANYNNFRYLIKFLSKLAEKHDVNKMKPSNIAIVIGPNLLWSEKNNAPNMMTTGTVSAIIEAIVTHADWFFPGAIDFHLTGHGSSPKPCREPGFTYNTKPQASNVKTSEDKEENIEDLKSKNSAKSDDSDKKEDEKGNVDVEKVKILPVEQSSVNLSVEMDMQKSASSGSENVDDGDSSSDENNPFSDKYEGKSASASDTESKRDPEQVKKGDDLSSRRLLLGGRHNGQYVAPSSSTNTGDYDNIVYTPNPQNPMYRSSNLSRACTLGSADRRGSADNLLSCGKQTPAPIPPSRPSRPSKRMSPLRSDQNSPFLTLARSGSQSPHPGSQAPVNTLTYQGPGIRQPNVKYLTGSTPNISSLTYNKSEEEVYSGFQSGLWNRPNQKSDFHSLKRGSDPCIIPPPPQFTTFSSQRPLKISRAQLGAPPKPVELSRSQSSSQDEVSRSPTDQGQSVSPGSRPQQGQSQTPVDKSFHQDAYSTAFALTSLGAGNKSTDYLTKVRAMWDDRHQQQHGKFGPMGEKPQQGGALSVTNGKAMDSSSPIRKPGMSPSPDMQIKTQVSPGVVSQSSRGGESPRAAGFSPNLSSSSSPGRQAELDFTNVGYIYEDDQEGSQPQSEKTQKSGEALHIQVAPAQQMAQYSSSQQASPGLSPAPSTNSSSSSLPVPSDSPDPSSPIQRRMTRKPAPPPPPDRPFTVMVTATTAGMSRPGNDPANNVAGGGPPAANNGGINSQSQTWPRTAPLASPESPEDPNKVVGGQEKVHRVSQPDRPSMRPPERPEPAVPERPRVPPNLNPPVSKGHQRSASAGAMINHSGGSFESSAVAGVPNADKRL